MSRSRLALYVRGRSTRAQSSAALQSGEIAICHAPAADKPRSTALHPPEPLGITRPSRAPSIEPLFLKMRCAQFTRSMRKTSSSSSSPVATETAAAHQPQVAPAGAAAAAASKSSSSGGAVRRSSRECKVSPLASYPSSPSSPLHALNLSIFLHAHTEPSIRPPLTLYTIYRFKHALYRSG